MIEILIASVTTLGIYGVSLLRDKRLKPYHALLIFLSSLWISSLFKGNLVTQDNLWDKYPTQPVTFGLEAKPTKEKKSDLREKYKEKYYEHKELCRQCMEDAKKATEMFPTIEARDKAEYCFRAGVQMCMPGSPFSRIIYGIITLAGELGVNVMQEWNHINTLLLMADSHANMVEFYATVLNEMDK